MDGGAWRLQSLGSLRVKHDWATSLSLFSFTHWRRKWQPTPVFLHGEFQGWGSLVGCRLWGRTDWCDLAAAAYLSVYMSVFVMGPLKEGYESNPGPHKESKCEKLPAKKVIELAGDRSTIWNVQAGKKTMTIVTVIEAVLAQAERIWSWFILFTSWP